ncbi:unnamed protein product [Echinostoma caproni]|uniref:CRAL-TRIO domain-containing protein n=1 Tax=Echinostoma caproni TaxID=27848 RepID=A0A183A1J0_9TREM|nr:unnamed protein product [Echinostoma caproni]
MMFWANFYMHPQIFRKSGNMGKQFGALAQTCRDVESWVAKRVMDEELPEISNSLCHDYSMTYMKKIPDRVKVDFAHVYHGLPASDANMFTVMRAMMVKASQENPVEDKNLNYMIKYARSFDLVRAAAKHKDRLLGFVYDAETGEQVNHKNFPRWLTTSFAGIPTKPPDNELGKITIKNFFPQLYNINNWYLDARDVTYVNDMAGACASVRHEENELMYALQNGRIMSHVIQPAQVIKACNEGKSATTWVPQATLAAKKENTKFGEKAGERELRGLFEQISEIMSQAAASVTKGMDPLAAYFHAVFLCFTIMVYYGDWKNTKTYESI